MIDAPAQRRFPIAGYATLTLRDGSTIDLSPPGELAIAESDLTSAVVCAADARRLVVVEKSQSVRWLVGAGATRAWDCLLMGLGGSPAPTMRRFIRLVSASLKLPVHVLTDNDPGGFDVFFLVQRGTSAARRPRAELATPDARFLGLRHDQVAHLSEMMSIALTDRDHLRLTQLTRHPWIRSDPAWRYEIDNMRERGCKVELEAAVSANGVETFVSVMRQALEGQP